MKTTLLIACLAIASTAHADGKKKPATKVDFSMGDLPALPKGDGMSGTKTNDTSGDTRKPADPTQVKYTLDAIIHAQQFNMRNDHYEPKFTIAKIDVANLPMMVPSFHTLVRVKSSDRLGAAIEVRMLDPQGAQVVSSQGALVFGGHDDAEFLVDWDPFTLKRSGNYQVEVSVAGQVIGKQPFPVMQQLSAHLVATAPDAGSAQLPVATPQPKETWP